VNSAFGTLIDAQIDINDTRVVARLESLPQRLQDRLYVTNKGLTDELLAKVEAREPVRTGRLRSLTQSYVDVNRRKLFVRGRVRVLRSRRHNTAAAAGALEYGSTGKRFPVSGYSRRSGRVRSYQRVGGITEMRFLRGPAAAMLPKARQALQRALREELAQTA
jgi:chromosome condensin MukBEF MukE localization factor